ncbi:dipeptidyl peptidase IV N-terminal region-domain-containing protein [Syncephalastrum racemosum]|uniref:Dipeptidyl peptidase IV N-terminal region-domain-containing protein n=1 Tax=Syncephalastrum racemosum TaxID=13706 RepID=A0A1X2HHB1_SYNRA|nr:dipeptidyl peptidase IV N-terminal region-domain-containing protein [Syncephalastrum racemosum]
MYKETRDEETNVHVWWEEWNSAWINVSNAYHFFENTEHGDLLWSSEKSGYRHLYMVSKQGDIYPVTEGEWCVMDLSLWVDESRHLVYFMAKKDTPLEAHLYVTCYLPGQHAIRRLTQPNYHHHIAMDPIAGVVVDTLSSLFQPQTVVVRHLIYKDDDELPSVSDVDPRTRLLLPVLPRLEDMAQIMEREGPRQQLLAIPTMELPSPDLVPPIGTIRPEIFSFIHKGKLFSSSHRPAVSHHVL